MTYHFEFVEITLLQIMFYILSVLRYQLFC